MWQHLLPHKVVLFPQLFNLGQNTTLLFYIRTAAQRQLTGFTNSVLTEGTVEDKLTPGLSFSHSKSLRKDRSPPCSPKIRWWWAACTHCLPPLPMTHRVRSIFCFFPQPGFGASSPSATGSPQNPWDIFLVEIPLIASCGCLHDIFWATMSSSQARPSHHWGVSLPQVRPSDPETRKWAYQTDHKKPVFHLWFYGAEVALSNLLLSPCLTLQYHQLWMSTAPSNKGRAYDSHICPTNGFVLPPALEKN